MSAIDEIPTEELEALVKKRKKAERDEERRQRESYEKARDETVSDIINAAQDLSKELAEFKRRCHQHMDIQHKSLERYGKLNKSSKGGFQVVHSAADKKVIRRRDTEPFWDERADKGVELIKDFLHTTVKKRDEKLFKILLSFIEKNQNGDLEYAKVLSLIKHRDKFDDARWVEGLRLIEESYRCQLKRFGYEFKVKDEHGQWVKIDLNFSSI